MKSWCKFHSCLRESIETAARDLSTSKQKGLREHELTDPVHIQLFREFKVVGKMCTRRSRKVDGISSTHHSWKCSCGTYICCFPLALANIRASLWRTFNSKPSTIPSRIVASTFSDNLSRNSFTATISPQNAATQKVLELSDWAESGPWNLATWNKFRLIERF